MIKKKNKILIIAIILIILCTGLIYLISRNHQSIAITYNKSEIIYFPTLLDNPKLYCVNHGLDFASGNYYCFETGQVDAAMAYLVSKQTNIPRNQNTDEIANAIWYLSGSTTNPAVNYETILNQAILTRSIKPTGNISIDDPKSPVVDNVQGKYGPFKINYPSSNGTFIGDDIVVSVNGNELTTLPNSGTEFYLTEADGIRYGAENKITIEYKASFYRGTYARFTPERDIVKYANCNVCNARFKYTIKGYTANNLAYNIPAELSDWTADAGNSHLQENCTGDLIAEAKVYYYDTLQNLIYVEPEVIPIEEEKEIKFWTGKSNILIQLNKINGEGTQMAEVNFNLSVTGGTINTATGPITKVVNGLETIKILPTKGSNQISLTLEEIETPEGYVKFEEPITINYEWDTSLKVWKIKADSTFLENDYITLNNIKNIRQTDNCEDQWRVTVINRPAIEISLDKTDTLGLAVPVDFYVLVIGGKSSTNIIRNGETVIIEPSTNTNIVQIALTEDDPGEQYIRYTKSITMEFTYDGSKWNMTNYTKPEAPEKVTVTGIKNGANVVAINRKKITIDLTKIDNSELKNALSNITFDINVTGGTSKLETITTNEDGEAQIVIIPNGTGEIILTLTEQDNNYYLNNGSIQIKFTYQAGNWIATLIDNAEGKYSKLISITGAQSKFELSITNEAIIKEITLVKVNQETKSEKIAGIQFTVILDNAKTQSGIQTITQVTDANGEIKLNNLIIIDPSKDITIRLKEGTAAGTGIDFSGFEEIRIIIKHKQPGCNFFVIGGMKELVNVEYDVNANRIFIEAQNKATIDLSGKVWLDGQTGLKPVSSPNGQQDSGETKLANIKVNLKRSSDNSIIETVYTDANGVYKFEKISVSTARGVGYYVEFVYDGINYIVTTPNVGNDSTDSDVVDVGRSTFNNKFTTITKDMAKGATGNIALQYVTDATSAKLQTTDVNGLVKNEFAMTATTIPTIYYTTTDNIDMGLVKKGVDLSAVTDIYSANVTINKEEQYYTYNDIISLEDNIIITEPNKIAYNLYLYNSDYNYRIKDYSSLPILDSSTRPTLQTGEYSSMLDKKKEDGELEIELTYQILLNNQSATDVTINEIAYYYDTGYILAGATPSLVTIDGKSYNKVIIPINKLFTDSDNQEIYNITFTLNKDSLGSVHTEDRKTWVEIISYGTNEGCIDIDSAPDNILEHKTEDDTDNATGLNIQIKTEDREIKGFVFEDIKSNNPGEYNIGNGIYDASEHKINDVIVQLIEIKNIAVGGTTRKLEYIWQETVTGANWVKYVTNDGKNVSTYTVANEPGHYIFKDFIPGNYIIRYIYGDGTYYDTALNKEELLKYNGQNYKSTKDIGYDSDIFEYIGYNENASMARDNEARRLEEISSATGTDGTNLIIDSKDKLEHTWMCAETSTLQIPISNVLQEQIRKNVNFGLVERPQTSLSLEKHITSFKIPEVTEAVTNMNKYVENSEFVGMTTSSGEGILATATNKAKNQRGIWILQTEKNLQGKNMEIVYTYKIQNTGDADYIGKELKTALNNVSLENPINTIYANLAAEVKEKISQTDSIYKIGTYVGKAYYTGEKELEDSGLQLSFKVEDYIKAENPILTLSGSTFTSKGQSSKKIWKVDNTEGTENVNVLQTEALVLDTTNPTDSVQIEMRLVANSLNVTGTKELSFPSYVAQLIPGQEGIVATTQTGIIPKGTIFGNLQKVQSYAPGSMVIIQELIPEEDEFIAETIVITKDTGADKETPVVLITSITGGLAVITIGIILIKKFVIK